MGSTLPNMKMLDVAALTDLISDNLSPPEITSVMYVLFDRSKIPFRLRVLIRFSI